MKTCLKKIDGYRRSVTQLKAKQDVIEADLSRLRMKSSRLSREYADAVEARDIVIEVSRLTISQVTGHINEMVTSALRAIFRRKRYTSVSEFISKSNRSEFNLLISDGKDSFHPKDEQGGSVVSVVSFALRVVMWGLQAHRSRRVLILDEPFYGLGSYIPLVSRMLKDLSSRLKLQIIMVTHSMDLAEVADRSWMVDMDGEGRSVVRLLGAENEGRKGILRRREREQAQTEASDHSDKEVQKIRRRRNSE